MKFVKYSELIGFAVRFAKARGQEVGSTSACPTSARTSRFLFINKLVEDYFDADVAKTPGKFADALFLGVVGLTIADEDLGQRRPPEDEVAC